MAGSYSLCNTCGTRLSDPSSDIGRDLVESATEIDGESYVDFGTFARFGNVERQP